MWERFVKVHEPDKHGSYFYEVNAGPYDPKVSDYDILVKLAHALVRHQAANHVQPPDDLKEETLDAAVRVLLKHKAANVINSILKSLR